MCVLTCKQADGQAGMHAIEQAGERATAYAQAGPWYPSPQAPLPFAFGHASFPPGQRKLPNCTFTDNIV